MKTFSAEHHQGNVWSGRSEVGAENLPFSQVPRWFWLLLVWGHALGTTKLRVQARRIGSLNYVWSWTRTLTSLGSFLEMQSLRPHSRPFVFKSAFHNADNELVINGISPMAQTVKNLPAMQETRVQSLYREDALEEGMATHSSILAWRIPWAEEPGGHDPQNHRVRHDWATN